MCNDEDIHACLGRNIPDTKSRTTRRDQPIYCIGIAYIANDKQNSLRVVWNDVAMGLNDLVSVFLLDYFFDSGP